MSRGTEARPCNERDMLVHYPTGRQTSHNAAHQRDRFLHQQNFSVIQPVDLVPVQWSWGWYNRVSILQQRPYRLAESGIHRQKTAGIDGALLARESDHFVSSYESHDKQFIISEKISVISCSENLSMKLQLRMLEKTYCCKFYSGYILQVRWTTL